MGLYVTWRRQTEQRRQLIDSELARLTAELDAQGARKVVLFGSHARGEASDTSDLDLLVVLPAGGTAPIGERAARLALRLAPRVGLDLHVYTPEEFEALRDGTPLLRTALREGKVLLER